MTLWYGRRQTYLLRWMEQPAAVPPVVVGLPFYDTYDAWPYKEEINTSFIMNRRSPQSRGLIAWWPLGLRPYGQLFGVGTKPILGGANFPIPDPGHRRGMTTLFDSSSSQLLRYLAAVRDTIPITVTAWFRSTTSSSGQTLLCISDVATDSWWMRLFIRAAAGGQTVLWNIKDAGVQAYADTPQSWTVGHWHFAAGRSIDTNAHAAFLDGRYKGSDVTDVDPDVLNRTTIGATELSIGTSGYMEGQIADVRVYNKALSDQEIWQMYNPRSRWDLYRVGGEM